MGLAEQYVEACETPSDIYQHLPTFAELGARAEKVVELGTRGGVSTLAWLYGLEGHGHLWSVDIDPAPEFEHPDWTFIQGDDLDPEVFKALPDKADIVFIDTSHTYKQTLAELNLYKWKVRSGGKIVLHDTELERPEASPRTDPPYPVKRAVEEFCADEGLEWTNHPNCFGLGIIDIP